MTITSTLCPHKRILFFPRVLLYRSNLRLVKLSLIFIGPCLGRAGLTLAYVISIQQALTGYNIG